MKCVPIAAGSMLFNFFLFSTALLLSSCQSNETGFSGDVNPEAVYFDYEIWADEGRQEVTVNLQYRMGGPRGTTLLLTEPSRVLLDGELLPPDSARFSGIYYEVQKPYNSFTGKHSIVFTDINGKEYREEIDFSPIYLKHDVPDVLTRKDLVFELGGLEPFDYIRVLLTDTSFASSDINEVDTVKNGRLVITTQRLSKLMNGPVYLQFFKEFELPVKNGTPEGGKISVTYGLKREFELRPLPK